MATEDWNAIAAAVKTGFYMGSHRGTVTLKEGGSFALELAGGRVRIGEVSDGLTESEYRAKCMCSDWDAASPGRPPHRGDELEIQGIRRLIEKAYPRGGGGVDIMYVMICAG